MEGDDGVSRALWNENGLFPAIIARVRSAIARTLNVIMLKFNFSADANTQQLTQTLTLTQARGAKKQALQTLLQFSEIFLSQYVCNVSNARCLATHACVAFALAKKLSFSVDTSSFKLSYYVFTEERVTRGQFR